MRDADDRKTPPPKEASRGSRRRVTSTGVPDAARKSGPESGETGRVIVVDDEANIRRVLQVMLEADGHTVFTTDDGREVLKKIVEESWDVIIGDVQMPKMHGHELLRELQAVANPPLVLVITAYSTWHDAVEAMRLGAHDYIRKPFDNDHIRATVARAIWRRRLLARLAAEGGANRPRPSDILGSSGGILEVLRFIQRAAPTDSTVLILGESGTGKELVARAVHYSSLRAQGPFIPVNCGGFTETLLESELFGHVRGSFTGAVADKKGLVEIADGGTFFLDEVAEMSPATQVKFLRVLENREFKPVGGVKTNSVDVRFITATNQDLERLVKEGRFREDLYYRLNVIPISIPPLRDRREDIPLLAGHFLALYSKRIGKAVDGIDKDAIEILFNYDWPGNVRELENIIERAVALSEGTKVTRDDLAGRVAGAESAALGGDGVDLEGRLEELERTYILRALKTTEWNLTRAAELLHIPFRSLRYRIKKLGIERPSR